MKVILKHKPDSEELVFDFPANNYKTELLKILEKCDTKCNGYVSLEINRPYRKRTTGENSQNNLFWKICTLIAEEVGDDSEGMKDTEMGIKLRALSKGYPFHVSKITGEKVPESMTKINTVEMSYLIDTELQIASELGIVLVPELVRNEPAPIKSEKEIQEDFNNYDIF